MSPKINVYLPDELAAEVKAAGIPVSAVCQQALADAVAGQGVEAVGPGQLHQTGVRHRRARADDAVRRRDDRRPGRLAGGVGRARPVGARGADIDPEDLLDEVRARQARDGGAGSLDALVERSIEQARGLGHSYVGTEHLLLGITAGPPRELANRTLRDMGLEHEAALLGVAAALSAYTFARESMTFGGLSAPIRAALEDIRSRMVRLEAALSPRG